MNRIVKSHVESFSTANGIFDLEIQEKFEHFINYCIGYKNTGAPFDTNSVTTDDPDAGIDGVICLIDNEIVTTNDESEAIFKRSKRNIDVKIIFTQATIAEGFSKSKISSFLLGVYDFIQDKPNLPQGAILKEYHEIFDTIIKNASKVSGGKPKCEIYYGATGKFNQEREILGAIKSGEAQIKSAGLFSSVTNHILDVDSLMRLWLECSQTINASVDVIGSIPLPKTDKIPESYLAIIKAKDFVDNLLLSEDNELRIWVFNENVRAFLGLGDDAQVNVGIQNTLKNPESNARFSLLNNGITIVSPDIRVQGSSFNLNGFQIVNGCQTSNVLFANREYITDETTVSVKFIEADDPDLLAEIVRATNKQTKVEDTQFLALEPLSKRIEEYFKTYNGDDQLIYLERRFRQYIGSSIPLIRIFDIKNSCRAVSAMFFGRPDLAMRYPNQMFEELKENLFDENLKEIIYYTSCLALYRINLMISNGKLPSNFRRLKWHLLLAARFSIVGKNMPIPTSTKITKSCEALIKIFKEQNPLQNKDFQRAVEYITKISNEPRNKITTRIFISSMSDELAKNN